MDAIAFWFSKMNFLSYRKYLQYKKILNLIVDKKIKFSFIKFKCNT